METVTAQDTRLIDRIRAGKVDLGNGVFAETIADGRIHVFIGTNFSRQGVDTWASSVMQVVGEDEHSPVLMLHDVVASGISTYSRQRSLEIVTFCRERGIHCRYAALVSNSAIGQAIRAFGNFTVALFHDKNVHGKVFTSRAEAEAYLMSFITE